MGIIKKYFSLVKKYFHFKVCFKNFKYVLSIKIKGQLFKNYHFHFLVTENS